MPASTPIYEHPAAILQDLIRFDTTNPPGNERPCIEYINNLLKEAGFETTLIARHPDRPNLLTRLQGTGQAPPLMLYAHTDVVTTENQKWTHPPFGAEIADGYIWGRGALDTKHALAMYLAALLKMKAKGVQPAGDVLFAATVDEEATCEDGAKFLVEQHAHLFQGVRHALSEFGGFNLTIAGKRFYLIQIAEKQVCPTRITFHGPGGHAANPVHGGAMVKLARALQKIDRTALPVHITQPVQVMLEQLSSNLGSLTGPILHLLLNPLLTDKILKILGTQGNTFSPLLHNTVSPTILEASDKRNVIPAEVTLELDGRLVPGDTAQGLEQELRLLLGPDCDIQAYLPDPGPQTSDLSLFSNLTAPLRSLDPLGIPIPYVNPAVTDARFFSKLGIQTYGYTPLQLPDDFSFIGTIHAADERVPVKALEFGTGAVYEVLTSLH